MMGKVKDLEIEQEEKFSSTHSLFSIQVYDVQFFKTDASGNDIVNADGSTKLFYAPDLDFSHVAEYVEDDDLVECLGMHL
jgi:hypothetical protein